MIDPGGHPEETKVPFIRILGTPVSVVSLEGVLRLFEGWITQNRARFAVFRDVHGVMLAQNDRKLQKAHKNADLVAPDGMPLVWLAKIAGINGISRVPGPDILPAICERGLAHGWRHYFFGGAPGIAASVATELSRLFPGIIISGVQSPPFRDLTREEDELVCAAIRKAQPHFIWVGLGTPKQEIWMDEHREKCGGAMLLGVGAAFDIFAGRTQRAPKWMQEYGIEWSFRLLSEPRRLWRRYLVLAPKFVFFAMHELLMRQIKVSTS